MILRMDNIQEARRVTSQPLLLSSLRFVFEKEATLKT
jgi:hypothetical protein